MRAVKTRQITILLALVIFTSLVPATSNSVSLNSATRDCLNKKIGVAATKKIVAAKTLNSTQKKQVESCTKTKVALPKVSPTPEPTPSPSPSVTSTPSPTPSPTATPTPSPTKSSSSITKYFQVVELPNGIKSCPFVPGFDVKEFTLNKDENVYALYGQKKVDSGTKVCKADSIWEYVVPVKPAMPLSDEAKVAVSSWAEFRSKRSVNNGFKLRFYIDPSGDPTITARDYLGFMETTAIFGPELGAGNSYSVAIGYTDKFITDEVGKDYFLSTTKDRTQSIWGTNMSQGGQCYGNFWAPQKGVTPKISGHVGDITLCNHRMGVNHSPDMAHTAPHELFHGVQFSIRPDWEAEFSMWWSEGSAFFTGSMIAADLGLLDIERNRAFWIAQLIEESTDRRLSKMNSNDHASRRAGFLAVELFISKYGFNKFLDVYKKQGELAKADPNGPGANKNFAPAFKAVTGQELTDFMAEADLYIERMVDERLKYPR